MRRGRDARRRAAAARQPGFVSPRPPARRRCSARWAWRGHHDRRRGRRQRSQPAGAASRQPPRPSSCHLGNGVKHVVQLTFDNVHFFRDNPNVPSDLELMPNLLNFFEDNGTFLSNNHTPLIAHTADDILTTWSPACTATGRACRSPTATRPTTPTARTAPSTPPTRPARSPTGPTRSTTPPRRRERRPTTPTRTWSTRRCRRPPRRTPWRPTRSPRAPWVPFTRAGCDVGDSRHGEPGAREHLPRHPQGVRRQLARGPAAGRGHGLVQGRRDRRLRRRRPCTAPRATRSAPTAKGVKFGQTDASPTAAADVLPDEPGGYSGFQALFGHRYVAPQLGAGTPDVTPQRLPGHQRGREPGGRERQPDQRRVPDQPPRLPRVQPHQRLADAGLHGRHAGVGRAGGERLHLRHPRQRAHPRAGRVQRRARGARQRHRVLRRPGAVLQRRVRHFLPAAGRRRHHPVQHGVRAQLRRGRPRGRRQRRPGHPAHPGQLRRRETCRAPTRPGPSASWPAT